LVWWYKSPAEGLGNGALWHGKRLTETNYGEFITWSSRAGITVTTRMSMKQATAYMWHDALVTKTKQRKMAQGTSSIVVVNQLLQKKSATNVMND
jgi:hypothetical protein